MAGLLSEDRDNVLLLHSWKVHTGLKLKPSNFTIKIKTGNSGAKARKAGGRGSEDNDRDIL